MLNKKGPDKTFFFYQAQIILLKNKVTTTVTGWSRFFIGQTAKDSNLNLNNCLHWWVLVYTYPYLAVELKPDSLNRNMNRTWKRSVSETLLSKNKYNTKDIRDLETESNPKHESEPNPEVAAQGVQCLLRSGSDRSATGAWIRPRRGPMSQTLKTWIQF